MNENSILIPEKDYVRIKHLLNSHPTSDFEDLETELDRASIISNEEVPHDLVTMNSTVKFLNIQENKEMIVTLVYPSESNLDEGKISILAPLGSALLGLKVNQKIDWTFPDGRKKTLKILEIINHH